MKRNKYQLGETVKMLFIEYPKCATCQRAKRFLDAAGVSYIDRHIKQDPPSEQELRRWYEAGGIALKKWFNVSGQQYRALGLKDKLPQMSEDEQLKCLASDGMLVKRPVLVGEDFVLVGFREEAWCAALQKMKKK